MAAQKLITSNATSSVTPSWRPSSQAVMAALKLIMSHSKGKVHISWDHSTTHWHKQPSIPDEMPA
eukprot:864646-Karenia_brevis.AAC.1